MSMRELRAMSPGKLGHGCNLDEIAKALTHNPHVIAVDAHMDHLLPLTDPCECFPVEVEEVGRVVTGVTPRSAQ